MGIEDVQDQNEVSSVPRVWPRTEEEWNSRLERTLSTVLEAPCVGRIREFERVSSSADLECGRFFFEKGWEFEDQIVSFAYGFGLFNALNKEPMARKQLEKWDRADWFYSDKGAYDWLKENYAIHPTFVKLMWLLATGQVTHA